MANSTDNLVATSDSLAVLVVISRLLIARRGTYCMYKVPYMNQNR